ncbi:hypothetical protein ACFPM3_28930 [Streptomyces coeruleoprunus]|uniref:DUF4034 domain-containing protein n=1 Tax=Streptomyces coeruleoprunus TaxID=285563 RepID=A0ABV9XM81_9ACTN
MEIARIVVLGLAVVVGIVVYRRIVGPSSGKAGPSKDAEALGLLPAYRQNTKLPAPAPELERVLVAAARLDWEPAARLLAETRESRDWERRCDIASSLGHAAGEGDGSWLDAWAEAAGPYDPDVAVVRAHATVALAWELRGAAFAKHTTREQFEGFHRVLAQAPQDIARAAELNPDDPTPYVAEIWTALGTGYPHPEMHRLWARITARAPHHYDAHYAALQYWCRKWRGSVELAESFAREAASAAPMGTLLRALPLVAWYEHHDDDAKAADFRSPELVAVVDAALADVAVAPVGHPSLAEVRHLLAYFLVRQGRHEAALEQFRLVDGHVNALPWSYYNDPAGVYCHWRDKAARGARKRFGGFGG